MTWSVIAAVLRSYLRPHRLSILSLHVDRLLFCLALTSCGKKKWTRDVSLVLQGASLFIYNNIHKFSLCQIQIESNLMHFSALTHFPPDLNKLIHSHFIPFTYTSDVASAYFLPNLYFFVHDVTESNHPGLSSLLSKTCIIYWQLPA